MRELSDGDFPFANDFNSITQALADDGVVLTGCTVHDGGTDDMAVDVDSGEARPDGSNVSVAAQSVTLASADANNDRYDLIVVDGTGSATDVTGTASTTPSAPAIPANTALLAIIQVRAGVTGVTDTDINGARGVVSSSLMIPPGLIAMWSGAIADIPSGWVLCDGANGTPNLQDRFVVGAGSSYAVDATGGESTHTLSQSELASHSHGVGFSADDTFGTSSNAPEGVLRDFTHSTDSSGGDSAHENKPPYHALAYIMKV